MKNFFLIICFLLLNTSVFATHWLTYYVYHETEYVQGPWTKYNELNERQTTYLEAVHYEDLFGTVPEEFVMRVISRLREKKPESYQWDYETTVEDITVNIIPKSNIKEWETVKNELTATLNFNGYQTVKFVFEDSTTTLTIDDVNIPYFDLVLDNDSIVGTVETAQVDTVFIDRPTDTNMEEQPEKEVAFPLLLIISGMFNIILLVTLIVRDRRRQQ